MNAGPLIRRLVRAANVARLECIVIGNAGAALNGAPVTTLDFDLFVRDTGKAMEKIRALARELGADVIPATSPLSTMVRVENEREAIYLDLIDRPAGLGSFAAVRARAQELKLGAPRSYVSVASLADIIRSKKALGRPKDLSVLPILELTLSEARKAKKADRRRHA